MALRFFADHCVSKQIIAALPAPVFVPPLYVQSDS